MHAATAGTPLVAGVRPKLPGDPRDRYSNPAVSAPAGPLRGAMH
jgi:hypothetical protein